MNTGWQLNVTFLVDRLVPKLSKNARHDKTAKALVNSWGSLVKKSHWLARSLPLSAKR